MSDLIDDPMDDIMCDKNGIDGDMRDAEDIANIKQIVDNLTIMRLMLENKRMRETLREALPEGSAEFWRQKAEIAYQQADQYKTDYLNACMLVANMYEAATGTTGGPIRGVVEDMEDLRAALTAAREEAGRLREEARWVPVIDKLPPPGVDVEFMQIHRGTRHGKQWLDNDNECAYRGITHWRPLPEPPALPPAEGETE